jgi:HSP20 family protein
MSLVPYEPITMLENLRTQLNKLFEADLAPSWWGEEGNVVTSHWMPKVDMREEDDRYVFLADIPGVDPKDIEVTAANGVLTIKGERKSETKEEKAGYKRIERAQGMFYRRFSLPDTADTAHIKANSKNGVLELVVPKHEAIKPRKIKIEG